MALPPETPRPPGHDDAFAPADDSLLDFLRRKLAGEPLPAAAGAHFHDADIYAADPDMLTAEYSPAPARKGEGGSWFFFTRVRPKSASDSRKSRLVGGGAGTWHSERAPRRVLDGEGNCVGQGQYFSYKRKVGKGSERTDWYMMEFCRGEDQEADHGRVHGGEPQLVLCKIYKAHAHSRSSNRSVSRPSSSASACKRKSTDDCADVASAPVKAKRKLFHSSDPVSAVTSQEELSAAGWYNVAAWQDNIISSAAPDSALGSQPEMPQEMLSCEGWMQKEKLSSEGWMPQEMLSCEGWMQKEKLSSEGWMQQENLSSEGRMQQESQPETPQEKFSSEGWTHKEKLSSEGQMQQEKLSCQMQQENLSSEGSDSFDNWLNRSLAAADTLCESHSHSFRMPYTEDSEVNSFLMVGNAAPVPASLISDSAFGIQQDPYHSSWMPENETEESQVNTSAPPVPAHAMSSASWTLDSVIRNEQDPCDSFQMPEREVSQVDTSSISAAEDAPHVPAAHCAPGALSFPSDSLISNVVTRLCCSEPVWLHGAPTYHDELGNRGAGFTGANMCSMPSLFPVPPPTSPSWWHNSTDIWTF